MVPFLTDEDFNGRILRGLLLRNPELDVVRVQDIGLQGAPDPAVLDWAAQHRRVLLTHDARTMPGHIRDRLAGGLHTSGVFIVDDLAPIAACIDDILLVDEGSEFADWTDRVTYLPLR